MRLSALLGRPGAKGRASLVQQDNGQAGNYGYRAGNWKLVRHDSKQAYNQRVEEQLRNTPVPAFQLFDLAKDVGESKDLSTAHPEVLERMKSELVGIITSGRSRP